MTYLKQTREVGLAAVIAACLFVGTAFGQQGRRLAPDLPENGSDKIDVIIQFNDPPGQNRFNEIRGRGGELKRKLPAIDGALFSMPVKALKGLANNPRIKYVSPDRNVQPTLDSARAAVQADVAEQYGWDGSGVGVAILDSGIDQHLDFNAGTQSRIVYQESFLASPNPGDPFGHGTHVAGIAAGSGKKASGSSNEVTFPGIAVNANVLNFQILDDQGAGTDSSLIAALQRVIELKTQYNIRVVNLSVGRPVYESYTTDPICQAVEAVWNAGIVVVVAAGNMGRDDSFDNDGYGTINSPGNDPFVITVGAMKTASTHTKADDTIASYSSKGPTLIDHVVKPDLVAPGNLVAAPLASDSQVEILYPTQVVHRAEYTNTSSNVTSKDYFRLSGTSMSAPIVSGAVALLLQQNPSLTPDQVKARLMKTAAKSFPTSSVATDPLTGETFTSYYDIFTIGAGYLDIQAALLDTEVASNTLSAASPRVEFNSITGQVTLVTDSSVLWGTNVVWGTSVLWGTSVVWGTNVVLQDNSVLWGTSVVWGTGVVWGTASTEGNIVVWGTDSPYANSVIWGTGVIWGTSVLLNGE